MKLALMATTVAIALVATSPRIVHAQTTLATQTALGQRETMTLKDGWRFKQDNGLSSVERPEFRDDGWDVVSVPHTWNRVGYYRSGDAARVNTPETINKTQGVGWYRLEFTAPQTFKGKRAWLQFDAASRTAEVWLNGVRLGTHAGGFSRFRLDATEALKPGQPNLLVVKTDNSKPEPGSATADTLPLSGDFFVHGGLYRPVSLIATDPVHLEMLDHGGPGIYAATTSIKDGAAAIALRAEVRNDSAVATQINVITRLTDDKGAVAAETSSVVALAPRQVATTLQNLRLAKAHLWEGVADPYLYKLVVQVRGSGGAVLDQLEQPFGVREMRFDPEKGFFLNGKALGLHGVGLHQDREGKGWAQSEADIAVDVDLIREMGANTIRLTHYQHGQPIHDLADRYGLILWDEIPLVSKWTLVAGQKEASPGLLADARQQLQELIRQNYNHPSVAVWGIANEVDFGKSVPAFLTGPGDPPDPLPLLSELNTLAKAEDPGRPSVLANCCEGRVFGADSQVPVVAPVADMSGANRYYGWYYGKTSDLSAHLETTRATRPNQPFAITEYGAGGAVTMHTDDPLGGPVDSRGRNQPEEYQSYVHEQSWPILQSKPYLWGTWLWNSFDFATTIRREGGADDINTKGLITYDRKVKKDAFFFYKANWTRTPTVHINGRRYVDRAYPVTDIRVYSNAPTTELNLNGQTLGALTNCAQKICVWKNVRLPEGAIALLATGRFSTGEVKDVVNWTLSPDAARNIRIDSGALMAPASIADRFGSDAFFAGGQPRSVNAPSDYGKPAENKVIAGASNIAVAATYREGDFRYRIPVKNGQYSVTLTFVEPTEPSGLRQFDVVANGARKLKSFDVAQAAGGTLIQVKRRFDVTVKDNVLDLRFKPVKGEALVSAIEVEQ